MAFNRDFAQPDLVCASHACTSVVFDVYLRRTGVVSAQVAAIVLLHRLHEALFRKRSRVRLFHLLLSCMIDPSSFAPSTSCLVQGLTNYPRLPDRIAHPFLDTRRLLQIDLPLDLFEVLQAILERLHRQHLVRVCVNE